MWVDKPKSFHLIVKNKGMFSHIPLDGLVFEDKITTHTPITDYFNPQVEEGSFLKGIGYERGFIYPVMHMAKLLKENNLPFPVSEYLGKVIRLSDELDPKPFIMIGHKGDEQKNTLDVEQLQVFWTEI